MVADAGWRVTVWNNGAERMYGWTAEEALAQPANFVRVDWGEEQDAATWRHSPRPVAGALTA